MNYYRVLGFDGNALTTLTSQPFRTWVAADAYAKTCARAWRAFVVVDAPTDPEVKPAS
jgi:hypothetical protein